MKDKTVYFSATLYPHRSLSPDGFRLLLICLLCSFFVIGVIFLVAGAWPVVGFMGLEILGLYIGFRVSYRQAKARETLLVNRDETKLVRYDKDGDEIEAFSFQTAWLSVISQDKEDDPKPLLLKGLNQSAEFAQYLSPKERLELARAFRDALKRATTAAY